MIRLSNDSPWQGILIQHTAERLRTRRKTFKNYAELANQTIKNAKLSASDRMKFELLHRQFAGKPVAGLPSLVSALRFLVRALRKVRFPS